MGNLPFSKSKQWIHHLFARFGDISDIFLSRKAKRPSMHFAFVHFSFVAETYAAIRELNGAFVNGCQLVVAEVSEKKSSHKCSSEGKQPVVS